MCCFIQKGEASSDKPTRIVELSYLHNTDLCNYPRKCLKRCQEIGLEDMSIHMFDSKDSNEVE